MNLKDKTFYHDIEVAAIGGMKEDVISAINIFSLKNKPKHSAAQEIKQETKSADQELINKIVEAVKKEIAGN